MELTQKGLLEVKETLNNKTATAVELVGAYIERINKQDKKYHAYLLVDEDGALKQAAEADRRIAAGEARPLEGVVVAVKDNMVTKGIKTTAASKILANFVPPFDATVVRKLKDAGAVIIGKTNMDEFAMGSSTENSAFGPTTNPWGENRVPGGSSGGSATAVAADLCSIALGSDTGGSIRQPASFCGVVGFKPTYGVVSRYGLMAYGSSLDQIGPIGKRVADCRALFDVVRGVDKLDSTSLDVDFKYAGRPVKKIGVVKEFLAEGLDSGVREQLELALNKIKASGVEVVEVSLPSLQYALAAYYIIAVAEASSNLSRYDGIKYGFSVEKEKEVKNLFEVYTKSRAQGFGEEVKRRIMLGTYTLSAGYFDAYYAKAQQVRAVIKKELERALNAVDFLVGPTSPTVAFKIGEKTTDPLSMYLADIYTVVVNLCGVPAISLPVGLAEEMPVGMQIVGGQLADDELLLFAEKVEGLLGFRRLEV